MKIPFRRSHLAVALIGTLTAPLLISDAQAKSARSESPFLFAKSEKKDKKDKKDKRDDRDTRNVTVIGVVTRDLRGNDRFTVRLEDGRTVEVIDREREPVRLSKGDRVELRGDFESGLFIADRVRILDNVGNGNNNNAQVRTLNGRVIRDYYGRSFELLRDNGDRIRVRSRDAEPVRLSKGDRVEIQGRYEGEIFVATDVRITGNDDRQRVDFPATVIRRSDAGRMTVRGDNNRTYVVISNLTLVRFDHDDRVRVKGFINGDIVAADSVTLLQNR